MTDAGKQSTLVCSNSMGFATRPRQGQWQLMPSGDMNAGSQDDIRQLFEFVTPSPAETGHAIVIDEGLLKSRSDTYNTCMNALMEAAAATNCTVERKHSIPTSQLDREIRAQAQGGTRFGRAAGH